MKMTSRFTLLIAVAGASLAGCSSPAEGGNSGPPPPPTDRPNFATGNGNTGQGGSSQDTNNPATGQGGTGQDNTGTGGTVSTPTAGTGNDGQAGTTTMPGDGQIPVGTSGFVLTPNTDGWVAGTTNQVGIQGSFYPIADSDNGGGGDTTITLGDFANGAACVSGVASQVQMGAAGLDYDTYWGGGLGFDLADLGGMMGTLPWDRGNVIGFSYTVSGSNVPASLRFQIGVSGNSGLPYCAEIGATGAGAKTTSISDAATGVDQACWEPVLGAAIPPTAQLTSIQWQVATNDMAPTPFDFCIENLTAVVQ